MTVAEMIIQHVRTLPEPVQIEVLDFIEYIETKTGALYHVSRLSENPHEFLETLTSCVSLDKPTSIGYHILSHCSNIKAMLNEGRNWHEFRKNQAHNYI